MNKRFCTLFPVHESLIRSPRGNVSYRTECGSGSDPSWIPDSSSESAYSRLRNPPNTDFRTPNSESRIVNSQRRIEKPALESPPQISNITLTENIRLVNNDSRSYFSGYISNPLVAVEASLSSSTQHVLIPFDNRTQTHTAWKRIRNFVH